MSVGKVWVTRPQEQAQDWVSGLRALGFDAHSRPLLETGPLTVQAAQEALLQARAGLWGGVQQPPYQAVMFVSVAAVQYFFASSAAPQPWPQDCRAWCTGTGTRKALIDHGGVPEACIDSPSADSGSFDSEHLWQRVAPRLEQGRKVLLVRGGSQSGPEGRDWLATQLAEAGVQCDAVQAYQRRVLPWPALGEEEAAKDSHSVWIISSGLALSAFVPAGRCSAQQPNPCAQRAVVTHPRIYEQAQRQGFFMQVALAQKPTVAAIAQALHRLTMVVNEGG